MQPISGERYTLSGKQSHRRLVDHILRRVRAIVPADGGDAK